jgi:hypothetical protein
MADADRLLAEVRKWADELSAMEQANGSLKDDPETALAAAGRGIQLLLAWRQLDDWMTQSGWPPVAWNNPATPKLVIPVTEAGERIGGKPDFDTRWGPEVLAAIAALPEVKAGMPKSMAHEEIVQLAHAAEAVQAKVSLEQILTHDWRWIIYFPASGTKATLFRGAGPADVLAYLEREATG